MKQQPGFQHVAMVLDHLFGSLRLVENESDPELVGVDLASGTEEALDRFKGAGSRLVVLVPGSWSERNLSALEQHLVWCDGVFAMGKRPSEAPERLDSLGDADPASTLFVSADRVLRGHAVRRGYRAAPGPAVAALFIRDRDVRFLRLRGSRRRLGNLPNLVPYFFERTGEDAWCVLGAGTSATLTEAVALGLGFDLVPLDLATEDPMFIRLDGPDQRAAAAKLDCRLLASQPERILTGVGWDRSAESLEVRGAHGHLQLLAPHPSLLKPAPQPDDRLRAERLALGRWPIEKAKVTKLTYDHLKGKLLSLVCPVSDASFQADVDRYSGASPLDSSGPIVSRHISHPDNARVVNALLHELRSIGYCAYTHDFSHNGGILQNVIADLPGSGYFQIEPWFLEELREIFVRYPLPDPPDPWLKEVSEIVGGDWLERLESESRALDRPEPRRLRSRLEHIFELRESYPWWRKACLVGGLGSKIVIVGCHFDSTAGFSPGYDPFSDPAPGADDNASGIAATLAVARHMWAYSGNLPHTVRFCFFNAEEQGLVGSKAYAAKMKSAGAPIKAVVCADMMGYNSDANRIYEIHAGYTDAAVRDLSVPVAETIATWSQCLGQLAPAQIYKGTSVYGGTDRDLFDGAINRSDHAAFHQQGYPAVLVSEDYFANLPAEAVADPNPDYHTTADTVVDSAYSADITCALAFSVQELAGG
ncbi:MAG: Zn-dependent exopeptidase M28 [bacterium]|nr:Zn-dependent exopeptidase M28 [bacterium]